MPSTESYQLLLAAAAACEDKKAEDIRILALDPTESGLTDYFLICNGTNERQNVAITDEIEIRLKRDFGTYPNSVEGRRQGEWILMDYVDFIVHVFSEEKRAFYGLERMRRSATTISVAELTAEMKALISSTRAKTVKSGLKPVVEKAPAVKVPGVKSVAANKVIAVKAPVKAAERAVAVKKVVSAKPVMKTAVKKIVAAKPLVKTAVKKVVTAKPVVKTAAKKAVAAKPLVKTAVKKVVTAKSVVKTAAKKVVAAKPVVKTAPKKAVVVKAKPVAKKAPVKAAAKKAVKPAAKAVAAKAVAAKAKAKAKK